MSAEEDYAVITDAKAFFPSVRKVLVFAPHPDDEVFGCGGALALLREQQVPITVIIVTNGAAGGADPAGTLVEVRAEESRTAARLLGLSDPVFWGCPDRSLAYGEQLIERLAELIRSEDTDLVLFPSPTELHPDHQALAFAGIEALRRLGGTLRAAFYEVNLPLPNPNLLIDISQVADRKMAAMRCFTSQLKEQPYDSRIEGLNRFRAYFLGPSVHSAEAFQLADAVNLRQGLALLFEGPLAHRKRLGFAAGGDDIPLVSIVVRSMNRSTLARALDSLALQTWPHCEVVVVNAQGGDHAPMPDYCGPFPLRLINQGGAPLRRSRAANCGLAACHGLYLGFLDDDDSMDPDHILHLVKTLLNQHGCRAAYSGVRGLNEQRPGDPVLEFREPGVDFTRLLLGNIIPIHAVLFPAELLNKGVCFDEGLDLYEDWDFWLQCSRIAPFLFVDRTSATYYAEGGSGAGLAWDADETVKRQAREALLARWLPRLQPAELDAIGNLYCRTRDSLMADQARLKHIIAQRDGEIVWRDSEIARCNEDIFLRDREIAQRDWEIVQRDQEIAQRADQLAELYASRSWKVSAPLRWSARQMRTFRQMFGLKKTGEY